MTTNTTTPDQLTTPATEAAAAWQPLANAAAAQPPPAEPGPGGWAGERHRALARQLAGVRAFQRDALGEAAGEPTAARHNSVMRLFAEERRILDALVKAAAASPPPSPSPAGPDGVHHVAPAVGGRETRDEGRETRDEGRETRDEAARHPAPSPQHPAPNPRPTAGTEACPTSGGGVPGTASVSDRSPPHPTPSAQVGAGVGAGAGASAGASARRLARKNRRCQAHGRHKCRVCLA